MSALRRLTRRKSRNPVMLPREDVWSIGIYVGDSPFRFSEPDHFENPILTREDITDVPAIFVADPFMLKAKNMWHLFFEVKNRATQKGEIALATSEDALSWQYRQIVLTEPFHLSYPYVFEWDHDYYMIPETWRAESIRLYRAISFPTQWRCIGSLVSGGQFFDSSIIRHADRWWLFSGVNGSGRFDTLRLYYAGELDGPWIEHPQSPIVKENPRIARPGGKMLFWDNKLYRYAQNCYPTYGREVHALEITEITTQTYREKSVSEHPVISATGAGWNKCGMHHVDPHLMPDGRWMAWVDGWFTA